LLAFACCHQLSAQAPGNDELSPSDKNNTGYTNSTVDAPFIVRNIVIEGNKKTRPDIILRELYFKSGDALLLQDLVKRFEGSRRQLMNTALFHEVVVALKSFEGYNVDVLVQVKERWYIFPVPYFKPVDRNLNQWLVEQKASLKRVNYGMKLLYNNATGRNDKLRLWLISGYTRQFSFNYERPYIDKKMKWGMSIGFAIGKNREINYNTIADKQVFLKDNGYLRNFLTASAELSYRKAIKTKHRFGILFVREDIADTVIKLNPDFFRQGRKRIAFPEFYYGLSYYDLDYIPYPTKGYAAEVTLSKKGIDRSMNAWQLSAKGSGNWPTGKKSFFSLNAFGTIKVPFTQPFYNRRLLGYSDVFLQGYEYYVIDGLAGGYIKAALTRKLFKFDVRIPGTKKVAPFQIPINIYGRIYGNAGYIYNKYPENNFLSNKMLYSTGFGVDITSIYDFTLKLEWSFNQLGQNGLFFHRKTIF
jgi:outer membrane protein assembly factor BamA